MNLGIFIFQEIFIDSNVIETSNGFPEHRTVSHGLNLLRIKYYMLIKPCAAELFADISSNVEKYY